MIEKYLLLSSKKLKNTVITGIIIINEINSVIEKYELLLTLKLYKLFKATYYLHPALSINVLAFA